MKNCLDSDQENVYKGGRNKSKLGTRMRDPVQSVYNRQVAKCLTDIGELWDIPGMVEDRIKKAIEFTCKDVDKLKNKNPNGVNNEKSDNAGNR